MRFFLIARKNLLMKLFIVFFVKYCKTFENNDKKSRKTPIVEKKIFVSIYKLNYYDNAIKRKPIDCTRRTDIYTKKRLLRVIFSVLT